MQDLRFGILSLVLVSLITFQSRFAHAETLSSEASLVVSKDDPQQNELEDMRKLGQAVLFYYVIEAKNQHNPERVEYLVFCNPVLCLPVPEITLPDLGQFLLNFEIPALPDVGPQLGLPDPITLVSPEIPPTKSKIDIWDQRTVQMVSNYFFEGDKTRSDLFSRSSKSRLPKQAQRLGALSMRSAFLLGEMVGKRFLAGPVFGMAEKYISKHWIFGAAEKGIKGTLAEIQKEIDALVVLLGETSAGKTTLVNGAEFDLGKTYDLDHMTEDSRLKMERAKRALEAKYAEYSNEATITEGVQSFLDIKLSADARGLVNGIHDWVQGARPLHGAAAAPAAADLSFLGNTFSHVSKFIVTPLTLEGRIQKLFPNCAPVVDVLVRAFQKLMGWGYSQDLDELEKILLAGYTENTPHIMSDSARCARAMSKLATALFGMGTLVGRLVERPLTIAAVELVNAGVGWALEVLPKRSKEDEIKGMVSALAESFYEDEDLTSASENLKKEMAACGKSIPDFESQTVAVQLSYTQGCLAKRLIAKDEKLMSFVILNLLLEEQTSGSTRTEQFLVNMLGAHASEVAIWRDLATYYGPEDEFVNGLVRAHLRLGQ